MVERRCGNCIYWHGSSKSEVGECHEGTPIMLGFSATSEGQTAEHAGGMASANQTAQLIWGWPMCREGDWCGKFKGGRGFDGF